MDRPVADRIADARAAFSRRAWSAADEAYRAAGPDAPLDAADLERAAIAAFLIGRDDAAVAAWGRAYQAALEADDPIGAARRAFWVGMVLVQRGELAVGGGWLGRAARILDETGIDCVERGFILIPQGLGQLGTGDPAAAYESFSRAAEIAQRFGDPDLAALGRLGRGRALIDLSEIARGVGLLDEAMVAVTTGEVSPIIVGTVYCASIEAFQGIYDLRRAQQWTEALTAWCASQPDLVPYRGRCLAYRAELMRLHGAWQEAIVEAGKAREWLSRPPPEPALGEAIYQQAELHRLRGDFSEADGAYREANRWGRAPEPGLALLRLAEGRTDAALVIIRRALDEAKGAMTRAGLLEPCVDIAIAAGDLTTARSAVDELARIAVGAAVPLLGAMAAHAEGVLLLVEGDAGAALGPLRRAAATWREHGAPYEIARVRVSIGAALRQLGDEETAALEFDEARRVFRELGARPDLARLDAATGDQPAPGTPDHGLSGREVEVLRLVAAGLTNRAIAADLGISERTVDRHVSNIFTKLDVSSRAAATAFAVEAGVR